jgi:hypothetical protein
VSGEGAITGAVSLWRNGTEQACYVEVMHGRYSDGSAISLLVQADGGSMTNGTGVTGWEVRLATAPSVGRLAKNTAAVKKLPDAAWLPPPAHFKAKVAPVFGPLIPTAEVPAGNLRVMDEQYVDIGNDRWAASGNNIGPVTGLEPWPNNTAWDRTDFYGSVYSRGKSTMRYAVRAGDGTQLERAFRFISVALTFATGSTDGTGTNYQWPAGEWNQQDVSFGAMGYWWTGYLPYRTFARNFAGNVLIGFMAPPNPGYDEGRITARQIGWALSMQLLGYGATSFGGLTPNQWMDQLVSLQMTRQKTSGVDQQGASAVGAWYEYFTPTTDNGLQSNFMAAMRCYYLALYLDYRGSGGVSAATVQDAIRKNADFMATQWNSTYSTWHYWSNWASGDAEVPVANMRGLALMSATADMLAYRYTGTVGYTTRPLAAAAMSAALMPVDGLEMRAAAAYGLKAYNEDFYMWQYVVSKYLGV